MDEKIREILKQDIIERHIIKEGIARIRMRQIITICVGVLIFIMLFMNNAKLDKQLQKEDAVINTLIETLKQGNELIIQQDTIIDSLQGEKK